MSTTRVIYWNNIPSPYVVERFNAIAERGRVDFEALFNGEREPDRSWRVTPEDWRFPASYLPASPAGRLRALASYLRSRRPDVMVSLYGSPVFAAGVLLAKSMGVRVVLRALKTFETWHPRSAPRELAKRALFRSVDGIHVPGPDSRAYVISCGARPERVIEFPEPVNVAHFACGASEVRQSASARRAQLALSGCVFLYVGRIWQGKGLDYLVTAYRRLREEGVDASLLLVGDGVDEDRYRAMTADLPGVAFTGFVEPTDLPAWYGIADVLVFPTLGDPYGHVVQEAMASSLPVIATRNAGDVAERIADGLTGLIVLAADAEVLYVAMRKLALDGSLRTTMGSRGYERIAPRTVEWWAGEFEAMTQRLASSRSGRAEAAGKAA